MRFIQSLLLLTTERNRGPNTLNDISIRNQTFKPPLNMKSTIIATGFQKKL